MCSTCYGHYQRGLIEIENQEDWTSNSAMVSVNYSDIYTVLVHEMGHAIGFGHASSTSSSVMYYSNLLVKRSLTTCDYNKTYDAYNPNYDVTVKLSYGAGDMKIDGVRRSIPAEGKTYTWRETTFPHTLEALDQIGIYHDDEYMMRFENWTPAYNYRLRSIPAQTQLYTANYLREFDISFRNSFIGVGNGGIIGVNSVQNNSPTQNFHVIETYSINANTYNQVINGIQYIFSRWGDNDINSYKTFYPDDHSTYTAYFTGKPSNSNRNLHFSTTVGQPITLYWNNHPNSNVTRYDIYRKVKHNGVMGTTYLIASRNWGTTSYTDIDYLLTSTYSNDLIYYDVRAYYSTEGTSADEDFVPSFGKLDISAKISEITNNNLPLENRLFENYPNPFNPTTNIIFSIKNDEYVLLKVYDVLGKEVKGLLDTFLPAGTYKIEFTANDLPSGMYIYELNTGAYRSIKKMLLTK